MYMTLLLNLLAKNCDKLMIVPRKVTCNHYKPINTTGFIVKLDALVSGSTLRTGGCVLAQKCINCCSASAVFGQNPNRLAVYASQCDGLSSTHCPRKREKTIHAQHARARMAGGCKNRRAEHDPCPRSPGPRQLRPMMHGRRDICPPRQWHIPRPAPAAQMQPGMQRSRQPGIASHHQRQPPGAA